MSGPGESKRPGPRGVARPATNVAGPPLSADPEAPLEAGLWLVATPIGNAADITLRALDVLARANVLACEDTRRTRKLLSIHGIAVAGRKLISYNDRNGAARRPEIMRLLAEGHSVAYASDAGTPLVADPGYRLVIEAQDAGFPVHTVPGPSAVLAALNLAGLPTDRFLFLGFLPPKSAGRRREASRFAGVPATLVIFESPRRLAACLADLASVLGADRPAAVIREITKLYEEVTKGVLGALATDYAAAEAPKGEIVIVIGPPSASATDAARLDELLSAALETASVKDAARTVAAALELPRRDVYARALELSAEND